MKKENKIKIYLALTYLLILILFLWLIFSKFTLSELTSYEFIKNNRNDLISIKESSYLLTLIIFTFFTIIWTLLLGFAMPIMLIAGFIFGKWFGTIFAVIGLSTGAVFLYLFSNFFFKDLIEQKFSKRFYFWNTSKQYKNKSGRKFFYRQL